MSTETFMTRISGVGERTLHTEVRIVHAGDPPAYPELAERTIHECNLDKFLVLQNGVESGRASVAILVDLPDGSVAFIETSARQFEMLAVAVRGAKASWGEGD